MMWVRLRFDIGWTDLATAFFYLFVPQTRRPALRQAMKSWGAPDDFLITLSVRSAFDLLLRTLQLPAGTEVLLSALTIPDMSRIVEMHGLVPVPVDTDEEGQIKPESLRKAVSSEAKMIVVAHLFGGKTDLDEITRFASDHGLLLVEDCAQSFFRVGDAGHWASDVVLFSFGPIKTSTALGGAVARIRDRGLRNRMNDLLNRDPVQTRASFAKRIFRFSLLKMFSGRTTAAILHCLIKTLGWQFDLLANSVVRGFPSSDLLVHLRRRPCVPLVRLLNRRWRSYDQSRIDRRIEMGRYMDRRIGRLHHALHSYWVYPIFVNEPTVVRERLCAAGFDATCQARMAVISGADELRTATVATEVWKHVVFLPWYPELTNEAVEAMAGLIDPSDLMLRTKS